MNRRDEASAEAKSKDMKRLRRAKAKQDDKFLGRAARRMYGGRRFVAFLLIYPVTITGWLFGAAAFFDAAFMVPIITVAAAAYVALIVLGQTAYLLRSRAELRRAREATAAQGITLEDVRADRARLGTEFANAIRNDAKYYSSEDWRERIRITANGDTEIVKTVTLTPGKRGIDLSFHSLYAVEATNEADVRFAAVLLVGDENDQIQLTSFIVWEVPGKKMACFVLLDRHYDAGESATIQLTWYWPAYSKTIVETGSETHQIRLTRECARYDAEILIERVGVFIDQKPVLRKLTSSDINRECTSSCDPTADGYLIRVSAKTLGAGDTFGIGIQSTKLRI